MSDHKFGAFDATKPSAVKPAPSKLASDQMSGTAFALSGIK